MLLFTLILIFFIIIILNYIKKQKNKEGFDSYGYGSIIQNPKKNCRNLSLTECLKCQNCGYVMTKDFNDRCVPGDVHGPYDKTINYNKYYHNDPFTRALIANDNNYGYESNNNIFDLL